MGDIERISAKQLIDEVAQKLDPLAFDHSDSEDKRRRRIMAYMRVATAYDQFTVQQNRLRWETDEILDAHIPE